MSEDGYARRENTLINWQANTTDRQPTMLTVWSSSTSPSTHQPLPSPTSSARRTNRDTLIIDANIISSSISFRVCLLTPSNGLSYLSCSTVIRYLPSNKQLIEVVSTSNSSWGASWYSSSTYSQTIHTKTSPTSIIHKEYLKETKTGSEKE